MYTYSSSEVNAILYDYNKIGGYLQIAPQPKTLNFTVSISQEGVEKPALSKTMISEYYYVYIDIFPQGTYLSGAMIQMQLKNGFSFMGACQAIGKVCPVDDDQCESIEDIENEQCRVRGTQLDQLQFYHPGPIIKNKTMRIKVYAKNPRVPTTESGLDILIYSHETDLLYEFGSSNIGFKVDLIKIMFNNIYFFWGIAEFNAQNKGCPIKIYLSDTFLVYNKIKLIFSSKTSFPLGNYRLEFNIEGVDLIQIGSIVHNFPKADNDKEIECSADFSNFLLTCTDIGIIQSTTTSYIGFAFASDSSRHDTSPFTNFGKLTFYVVNNDGTSSQFTIATEAPSMPEIINAEYSNRGLGNNQIIDIASGYNNPSSTDLNNLITGVGTNSRSGIKYTSDTIDLLFTILATQDQKCCKTADKYLCSSTAVAECNAPITGTATKSSHIMLKVIANYHIFSEFSAIDPTNSQYRKGIDIIQDGLGWMYDNNAEACDVVNSKAQFCNSYTHYSDFKEITERDSNDEYAYDTGGFFNQWEIITPTDSQQSSYFELSWACTSLEDGIGTCAVDDSDGGFILKSINFISTFFGNPLFPGQLDIDFIVCFRYDQNTVNKNFSIFNMETQGKLASSGIIHGTVIHYQSSNTQFRFGMLNYYDPSKINYEYLPTFLRVGGFFDTNDFDTKQDQIAVFLDQGIDFTSTASLKISECASTYSSQSISCNHFGLFSQTFSQAMILSRENYYPQLSRIVITDSINSEEFNYYIPVQFLNKDTSQIKVVYIAQMSDSQILKIFTVYGNTWSNLNLNYFTTEINLDNAIVPDIDSNGGWIDITGDQAGQTSCDASNTKFPNTVIPNQEQTISITSEVTSCSIPFLTATANKPMQHFIVHADENFWNTSELDWQWTNTSNTKMKAQCVALNYTINSKSKYTLICPFDYPSNSISPTTAGNLQISLWKFPFNFGSGAPLRNKLRYIWSGADGNLGMYRVDISLGNPVLSSCTVHTDTSHSISTNFQKVSFQLRSSTIIKLTSSNNQIQIKQIFSSYPDIDLAIPQCYVDGLECTVIRSSNTNIFNLKAISIPEKEFINKTFEISFWVNGGPSSTSVNYKGELLAQFDSNFYTINDCPAYEN